MCRREENDTTLLELGEAMKLGFIGLGQMGKPMAVNLLKSGGELIVADRDPDPLRELEAQGARATTERRLPGR